MAEKSLSLASINVERNRHYERVLPFLREQQPEVVCVQELLEEDIPLFEQALSGATCIFTPMCRIALGEKVYTAGIGVFSQHPIRLVTEEYYVGTRGELKLFDNSSPESVIATMNHAFLACELEVFHHRFIIATTHFVWTPNGMPNQHQLDSVPKLLSSLKRLGEFVLVGDFNAPRGGEVFGMIAAEYHDNIPLEYTTSIDGNLHRVGALPGVMVDGMFTTPEYQADGVRLINGVSDHCAVVGKIEKLNI